MAGDDPMLLNSNLQAAGLDSAHSWASGLHPAGESGAQKCSGHFCEPGALIRNPAASTTAPALSISCIRAVVHQTPGKKKPRYLRGFVGLVEPDGDELNQAVDILLQWNQALKGTSVDCSNPRSEFELVSPSPEK
jgi:hypothetical protein